jgi:hypothetical protein
MGLTAAYELTVLDASFASGDYIGYSTNGTTETGILARTAVGAWASAASRAKAINAAIQSAAASGGGTITHFAVFSASTSGTQKTDWTTLASSRTVATGDKLDWAAGALSVAFND